MMLNLVQPLVRWKLEPLLDFLPAQAGPVAKINLPQPGENDLFVPFDFQRRRERLLDALHRTGVNRVNRFAAQVIRENFRLLLAVRRQVHVNPSAESALILRFDFRMADQQKSGGRRHR